MQHTYRLIVTLTRQQAGAPLIQTQTQQQLWDKPILAWRKQKRKWKYRGMCTFQWCNNSLVLYHSNRTSWCVCQTASRFLWNIASPLRNDTVFCFTAQKRTLLSKYKQIYNLQIYCQWQTEEGGKGGDWLWPVRWGSHDCQRCQKAVMWPSQVKGWSIYTWKRK